MINNLEELLAREQVRDVIRGYCHAIDCRDWAMVRSAFAEDGTLTHGSYSGSIDDFLGFAEGMLNHMGPTVHVLGNIMVDFDGDTARTVTPFSSFHTIPGNEARVGPVQTHGVDTDWFVAGHYRDTLEKRHGVWKIIVRVAGNDWTRAVPSHSTL